MTAGGPARDERLVPGGEMRQEGPVDPSRPARAATADWLLFLVPSVIWGTTWLAIKLQLGPVAPTLSVAYRFGLSAALLFGWCALRRIPLRFGPGTHASLAMLGAFQYALNYVLVYSSEEHLTSGLVALVFGLLLLWNVLGARLFFRTPITGTVVIGGALGLVGVTLVLWPDLSRLQGVAGQALGILLAMLATLSSSAGNLWAQRVYQRGLPVIPSTAFAMLYGALAVFLASRVAGVPLAFAASLPYLASLAYLALFGSIFAFLSYLTLIRRIGAGPAGYSSVVIPVVAMAASTVFEGYRWTARALAGRGLVLAGNVLVLRRPAGRPAAPPPP